MSSDDLRRFTELVVVDPDLWPSLVDHPRRETFCRAVSEAAAGVGLRGSDAAARAPRRPRQRAPGLAGALGVTSAPLQGTSEWTPVRVDRRSAEVAWCWTRGVPFSDPFFAETIERAMRDPFRVLYVVNRLIDDTRCLPANRHGR